jgi:hypothetical protein
LTIMFLILCARGSCRCLETRWRPTRVPPGGEVEGYVPLRFVNDRDRGRRWWRGRRGRNGNRSRLLLDPPRLTHKNCARARPVSSHEWRVAKLACGAHTRAAQVLHHDGAALCAHTFCAQEELLRWHTVPPCPCCMSVGAVIASVQAACVCACARNRGEENEVW